MIKSLNELAEEIPGWQIERERNGEKVRQGERKSASLTEDSLSSTACRRVELKSLQEAAGWIYGGTSLRHRHLQA